jgi:serine/threonine-protein kinase
MVDLGGSLYLIDFGIARHAESTRTSFGRPVGTAYYMAPEQFIEKEVSAQTDIYGLGVLLFEIMTGQRPFSGDEAACLEAGTNRWERVRYAHLKLPPPDPRSFNPEIPAGLSVVVMKALAKDPLDRYHSTLEFFQAACEALGWNPLEVPDRVNLQGLGLQPLSQPHHEQYPKRLHPLWVGGTSIAVLVFAALLAWAFGWFGSRPANLKTTDTLPVMITTGTLRQTGSEGLSQTATVSPAHAQTASKTATKVPTKTQTRRPIETKIPTGTPIPQCLGAPKQRISLGDHIFVCTKEESVFLRERPDHNANYTHRLVPGAELDVIGKPVCDEVKSWWYWKVKTESGYIGWIAEGGDKIDPYFVCPTR